MASNYPLLGGVEGDDANYKVSILRPSNFRPILLVSNHLKTYVTTLVESSTRLVHQNESSYAVALS